MTVADDGMTLTAGAAPSEMGVLTVALGAAAAGAGAMTVSEDGMTVTAAAALSEAGVLIVALGAAETGAVAMTVSEEGMTVTMGAAAAGATATAQCSEIMVSSVTAKLLSEAPELTAPFALCPVSFRPWPRCGVRSTLLAVILKV